MAEGYTQVATDGSGRKIESLPITVPVGTVVTNADGTTTTLTADISVFRQIVTIGDPSSPRGFAAVEGEEGRGGLRTVDRNVELLESIDHRLEQIVFLLSAAMNADATEQ